jgi:hypothetical protein
MSLWSNGQKVERLRELARLVHEAHDEMTDLITGNDLDLAEHCIGHALKVLQSREATA